MRRLLYVAAVMMLLTAPVLAGEGAKAPEKAPFNYVWGTAYHILPQTHSEEAGYFALSEGLAGEVYVGTEKTGVNSYLVEFDPWSEQQKIVIDTQKVCGVDAKGNAAQAKVHTRTFVGPSGKVYCGSMSGHTSKEDPSVYPGGYVMTYDPRTGIAENLGMAAKGESVIDVVADEARGLIYVVTMGKSHGWLVYDLKTKEYTKLGANACGFGATLVGADGRASLITDEFKLAQYDPEAKKVTVRELTMDGKTLSKPNVPCWNISNDKKRAYLVQLDDPTLIEIDLVGPASPLAVKNHGKMIGGTGYDSRGAISVGPDDCVYTLFRVTNETGFGTGYLHHLLRFDPKTQKTEDLGVLAVKNPEFFDFKAKDAKGNPPPWSHGYHTLPDGTLTPLHVCMALAVGRNRTIYATIIYPFTLLKIDQFKLPEPKATPGKQYMDFALGGCEKVQKNMAEIVKVAEIIGDRHIAGGLMGVPLNYRTFANESEGRSGGLVHMGFGRGWKKDRTEEEKKSDVVIADFDKAPEKGDLEAVQKCKEAGCYIVILGPKAMPEMKGFIALADAWFDTGFAASDGVVALADGSRGAGGNALMNMLNGWVLNAEIVSAITRRGKMPTMWKSYLYAKEGIDWGNKYQAMQFHDDYKIAAIPAGQLGQAFLDRMQYHMRRFERENLEKVQKAGEMIAADMAAGRKSVVATSGHWGWTSAGRNDDATWANAVDLHSSVDGQMTEYPKQTPDGALVVRMGYVGFDEKEAKLFDGKNQRVILFTGHDGSKITAAKSLVIDMDLGYAFGDACVAIEGYPIRILPPSGVMTFMVYESINAEALTRISAAKK